MEETISQYQCMIDYEIPEVNEQFPHLTMHWIGYFEGNRRTLNMKVKECLQALRRGSSSCPVLQHTRRKVLWASPHRHHP
jgi:hypothetical protein